MAKILKSAKKTKPSAKVLTKADAAAEADPRLAAIAKAYASDKRVTMGKLFSSVGLNVNGRIFAMVVRGRLVVKLPKARVDELVARGDGRRFEPGPGRVMKEWLTFTGEESRWKALAREAYAFVGGAATTSARRQ
jgi:TfoX/Sxy family transcriptional regulator of competence genes